MTTLGKILLLLNLGLSLAFAGWALGVYMHRIPLASRTTETGERIVGKVEELSGQIKRLHQIKDPAEARYQARRNTLLPLEDQRPKMQQWYAEQLDILLNGENVPVLELAVQNGQLVQDPMMRQPVQIGGQPAQTVVTYLRKYKMLQGEIEQLQVDVNKLIKAEEDLTTEVATLRTKIYAEEATLAKQQEEVRSLVPVLLNYKAEGQLLIKRRDGLKARRDELLGLPPVTGD